MDAVPPPWKTFDQTCLYYLIRQTVFEGSSVIHAIWVLTLAKGMHQLINNYLYAATSQPRASRSPLNNPKRQGAVVARKTE